MDNPRARAEDNPSLRSLLQFVLSHKLAVANFELDIHVLSCGAAAWAMLFVGLDAPG
jgi:hypothetical protein